MTEATKESQYQFLLAREKNLSNLGLMSSQVWQDDPKRLLFVLARYKFVAKMFSGMNKVLEVGCADAFGTRIVRQEVPNVVATDFDPVFIKRNQAQMEYEQADPKFKWNVTFEVHDMFEGPLEEGFDGVYAVDVIEHISAENGQDVQFVGNMAKSLNARGVCLIGTPSLESQDYASAPSVEGHCNCKTGPGLKELMSHHFHNVFIFSMNDEVVHTGFHPMAHYRWALCCNRK